MWKKLISIFLFLIASNLLKAQELSCKVTILHDKLNSSGVDPLVFSGMEKAIADFVNTRRWTSDNFTTAEKIECNIFINLTANNIGGDPNSFSGTFSIQASRPVFNASYTSTIVNYVDKDFTFKYSQFNPLNFDNNRVNGIDAMSSNLTAVIAYYVYVVLAMDYDSFEPNGGTTYLKRAQNIVNNAPEGKGITGWKAVENNRNRYWLTDQLLNLRFSEVRSFWYTMHREGLDSMSFNPTNSRMRILANIKKLYQINRENPSSILMQFIFNAKSDEIIKLVEMSPRSERQQYITLLSAIDVANSAKYNALK